MGLFNRMKTVEVGEQKIMFKTLEQGASVGTDADEDFTGVFTYEDKIVNVKDGTIADVKNKAAAQSAENESELNALKTQVENLENQVKELASEVENATDMLVSLRKTPTNQAKPPKPNGDEHTQKPVFRSAMEAIAAEHAQKTKRI